MEGEKTKKIGNITLDLSMYGGNDGYSEGYIEDELLKAVQYHTENEYNGVIAASRKWGILYHLSHIRGNIVDFLPITENQKVLEVGAGCGAVTGTIASKAGKVTCIELSLKRSMINAERNKERKNIEIKVGNFQDIEKKLTEKYDYIMLIGVFEYAGSYINDPSPYEKFLEILSSHLAQGGQIVIAIENKYGMKYFAGCREDHTGIYYDGIEGYRNTDDVKTFSRDALIKLAKSRGMECEFYYPYPDYKLPMTIYSDSRLPMTGELDDNIRNFVGERFTAFNEGQAFNEALAEGKFPMFSNSFLMLLSKEDRIESFSVRHPLYSKHSNERDIKYCIRTDLEEDGNGNRVIVKYPLTPESVEHLENMSRFYERLSLLFSGTKLHPNRCKRINDGEGGLKKLEFEYLDGPTLDDELKTCISEGRTDDGLMVIRNYCETLRSIGGTKKFQMTDSFKKIFGDVQLPESEVSMTITDLDLIFSNFVINGGWNVIDYEWTYDFPIPLNFVIYRAVFYFIKGIPAQSFEGIDLYTETGISSEECQVFGKMEESFQKHIAGDRVSLDGMYSIMGGNNVRLERVMKAARLMERPEHVRIYFNMGRGFNENDTMYIESQVDDEYRLSFDIDVPEGCSAVRIDPATYRCMVKIYLIENGIEEPPIDVNGFVLGDNTVIFDTDDPQIIVGKVLPGMRIHVEYIIQTVNEQMFDDMASGLLSIVQSNGFGRRKQLFRKGVLTRIRL